MDIRLDQQDSASMLPQPHSWLVQSYEHWELSEEKSSTHLYEDAWQTHRELDGLPVCPACGRTLQGAHCPRCPSTHLASRQKATDTQDRTAPIGIVSKGRDEEEATGCFTSAGAPPELRKALAIALKTELPKQAAPIIDYLVGKVDESGYLRCTVEKTARILRVSVSQVEEVLAHLHAQTPVGIGARDVRECFLLQLRQLEARGQSQPYAVEIVSRFLPELAQQKYSFIARQVGISRKQVKQVQCFLKQWLTPFPASRTGDYAQNFAGSGRTMQAT